MAFLLCQGPIIEVTYKAAVIIDTEFSGGAR